jgi:hypothetical protein
MSSLPEFVGTVHIILGPYRGNPIALYLNQEGDNCRISPRIYPWNRVVGEGETTNKAAANFEAKWKEDGLAPEMFTGPHWEGGIKPEKPKPPPKPPAPKPETPAAPAHSDAVAAAPGVLPKPEATQNTPSATSADADPPAISPPTPNPGAG